MKVTVFGIGYVGLVQAAVLAEVGHNVVCVDVDAKKIEGLKAGQIPIFEPDLDELVERSLREGRLVFTTDAKSGVDHASIQFIAVGTPPNEDGSADLKHVTAVARTIAQHMTRPQLIVNKSTVPVGTGDLVREVVSATLAEAGKQIEFDVVSNPEFLKEGSAVADSMKPDRIIIGTSSKSAEALLRQLYAPFNRNREKMIVMDMRSAELTKYAANAMLATKISFMNEMSRIAEGVGADIEWVRKGIGADPRIGYSFIYPGIGYGGSCLPKDVRALIHTAETAGVTPTMLTAVEARNTAQKHVLFDKVERYFGGDLKGKTFAIWGLAFKPNTDDMREAPSRVIMEALWAAGANVRAYDPEAMAEAASLYGRRNDLTFVTTREDALEGADALIVATEWKVFQSADFETIRTQLKRPAIFDGRNIYDPAFMKEQGFDYFAIGRGQRLEGLMAPRFTVIVPVYEQWNLVPALLDRLTAQSLPAEQFEVILSDNGSKAFAPPATLPANTRIVRCMQPGSYAARNAAAAEAQGEWFAFTDSDCLPEPGWLAGIASAVTDPDTILIGAVNVRPMHEPANAYEIYDMIAGIPQERFAAKGYGATANLAASAALFRRVGGFDASRLSGGDAEFCRRATAQGARVKFVAGARVDHPARDNWESIAIKSRRVLGGQLRSGPRPRRIAYFLRALGSPILPAIRFAAAPYPVGDRLAAMGVQLRLWGVEVAEAFRLIAGGTAERR